MEIYMAKVKILQFPIANSFGGITHYALDNWKWMDKEQFQCDFATMSKKLDFADEILNTGSKIHYISCYAEENKEKFIEEFSAILDEEYDVVHLHTKQWKSFLVEELCKAKGVKKVIVHAHSTGIDTLDEEKREFEINLHEQVKQEFTEELATDFWACSKLAADFLFGKQIPSEKIRIMPNAIELDKFKYNEQIRQKYREDYNLQNSFVIGNVGRMVYQKNQEFLIDVFFEVRKSISNAKLVIIGDGELREKLEKQVEEYGLENDVLFWGKREDVNCWYQVMDVFCLPSRFEGLGIVMIEAQAAGLPCVGSVEIPEEVEITECVIRLPFIIEQWEETIVSLEACGRKESRDKLVEKGYSISKQIKEIEREYIMSI